MNDFISRKELQDAIKDVKDDMRAMEARWLGWTATVNDHLADQDTRINWNIGLTVTLLLTVIGGLISLFVVLYPSG